MSARSLLGSGARVLTAAGARQQRIGKRLHMFCPSHDERLDQQLRDADATPRNYPLVRTD